MLEHELRHFQTFDSLLKARGIRPCYALPLWMIGGWMLGSFTAVLGRKAIWVCTAAIENTVNQHLLEFARDKAPAIVMVNLPAQAAEDVACQSRAFL